jgi:MoaA/NifB/PqqE/SkfB family radical SAM enzyme
MSTELFSMLLKHIKKATDQYKALTFAGMGEPLLDPEFVRKVQIARSEGFRVLLLTNGSRLSIDLFKKLDGLGVESIRISFYGMQPETYAHVHGINGDPNRFYDLRKTLSKICQMPRKTKMLFTFNLVENINQKDLESWIQYW